MRKVKCFACQNFGHYVLQCQNKKKKKKVATYVEVDEFVAQLKNNFSLLVYHSLNVASSSIWYIDSGATSHMTGIHKHFSVFLRVDWMWRWCLEMIL